MKRMWLGIWLLVVATYFVVAIQVSKRSPAAQTAQTSSTTTVRDDRDLLIERCGKPDSDTEFIEQRPGAPRLARALIYKKAHLVIFFAELEANYLKLFGIADSRSMKPVRADQIEMVVKSRMPCWITKPQP